jgi:peroxiredoxin
MTSETPTISAGAPVPAATVHIKSDSGIDAVETTAYFGDGRTVMFVVPGAFTPTCSAKHLPGFLEHADKFRAAGFDRIACLAVNDAHVMRAWGDANSTAGVIDMLADPRCEFADALGISRDMGPVMGRRAARCAMIIENGVVKKVFMEEPAAFEVSSATHVLANL